MNSMKQGTATGAGRLPRRLGRGGPALLATAAMGLMLSACGGGGGGADVAAPAALGLVKVTVSDLYGSKVAGATVQGPQGQVTTDALGVALVPMDSPASTAGVTISHATFVDKVVSATSTVGQVAELNVTLARATTAAGGSLTSRSGSLPSVDTTGQQMSFEIELVVVDGDANPITHLTAADFALQGCTPNPATAQVDCVRGSASEADVGYTPAAPGPEAMTPVAGRAARPYAAALLLDQSGSIQQSDPTGARLFSSKAFLNGLGADDQALLTAFADGPNALLPTRPLTLYAPFRARADVSSYFPTLDALTPLVGGNTPLYASIDALRQYLASDAPAGLDKAMVIFTDGADTDCGGPEACRALRAQTIQRANQDRVQLITIGLSSGVDIAALGELANQTGGALLFADTVQQLLPLYGSVGRLLSQSLPTYRLRWTVQAGAAGVFRPGHALLGKVQVNAGGRTFDVPFIVGIP
ncbi:MAG: vWA domain-containing protein [Aquabacterium sp.]|nr:vWA domain-containing protein [Aquabacterium sp.]